MSVFSCPSTSVASAAGFGAAAESHISAGPAGAAAADAGCQDTGQTRLRASVFSNSSTAGVRIDCFVCFWNFRMCSGDKKLQLFHLHQQHFLLSGNLPHHRHPPCSQTCEKLCSGHSMVCVRVCVCVCVLLPSSVGVGCQSHDALLAEVTRLEVALEDMRRDVEGLTAGAAVTQEVRGHRLIRWFNYLTNGSVWQMSVSNIIKINKSLKFCQNKATVNVCIKTDRFTFSQVYLKHSRRTCTCAPSNNKTQQAAAPDRSIISFSGITRLFQDVHAIVKNALRLFSQDQTGLADYALESGGGSILSTRCSETYETKAALLSLFGVPLWYFSQSPRAVIQPDVHPGNCWAFRGSTGFLVIRLSMRILPTAFSLEHIPKALAPSGALHSAPRDFCVFGLDDESQERGTLLGTYTYDEDGEALQTYPVTVTFQVVEVQVLSNWGHPEYTCMYRFRVHGTPSDP
uniref:SUN domain-containing protein n=1 Tax=Mastacembelus armatus TaxID=205130 RepID=A0A7N8YFZ9_9TELE